MEERKFHHTNNLDLILELVYHEDGFVQSIILNSYK